MKAKNFREKNNAELSQALVEAKSQLLNLRFELATGETKAGAKIADLKKDIARIKTILRLRELNMDIEPQAVEKKTRKAK